MANNKKQGKVVSKSLSEVGLELTNGMQVLHQKHGIGKVAPISKNDPPGFASVLFNGDESCMGCETEDLRTLVVEFPRDNGEKINPVNPYKEIPLKYTQWQSSIDNGEVDNENKYVTFEIKGYDCEYSRGNPPKEYEFASKNGYVEFAKIIPNREEVKKVTTLVIKAGLDIGLDKKGNFCITKQGKKMYDEDKVKEIVESLKWAYETIKSRGKLIPLKDDFNLANEIGKKNWEKYSNGMCKIEKLISANS